MKRASKSTASSSSKKAKTSAAPPPRMQCVVIETSKTPYERDPIASVYKSCNSQEAANAIVMVYGLSIPTLKSTGEMEGIHW